MMLSAGESTAYSTLPDDFQLMDINDGRKFQEADNMHYLRDS